MLLETFRNTAALFIFIGVFTSCAKEQTLNVSSTSDTQDVFNHAPLLGRQRVITLPTGDYNYPTANGLLWKPLSYRHRHGARYPLIFNLYGTGQNGTDINIMLHGKTMSTYIANGFNATAFNKKEKKTYEYIVFSPQCPSKWGWSAKQVKIMLQALKDSLAIDANRIYLTGFSAGGWGLWSCITDDESLCSQFAAIVPISTATADHPDKITNVDKYGIACWNICGDQDSFYKNAVAYTDTINKNKPPITAALETLAGLGHSAWVKAYDSSWVAPSMQSNIYDWLIQYKRP